MLKSRYLKIVGYVFVLFAVSPALYGEPFIGQTTDCGHECVIGTDTTIGTCISTVQSDTVLDGHPAFLITVDSLLMEDVGGAFEIVLDTDHPASESVLKAVTAGSELFPAVHEVYFNWKMFMFPDTFLATTTVTVRSDELDDWPTANMRYTPDPANYTVWFLNVDDPTDSIPIDISASEAFINPRLPVPSLTNWGMLVLLILLILTAIIVIRQRRRGVVSA